MNTSEYIYLDYAASTPVLEEVLGEMIPFYSKYCGNPSNSNNAMGEFINSAINHSKESISDLLNAYDYKIVFNSGATEGINTCLKSLYTQHGTKKKQIITCKTEHKAVIEVCDYLQSLGAEIVYLPVNEKGNIDLNVLQQTLSDNTLAVVLMAVNNETGVMHDIQTISAICVGHDVRFVCDASQAVGKIEINLSDTPIDYLILSGHKMYAPKGIGAILFNKKERVLALIQGGGQQNNIRSGTLNVTGIIGLGKAAEILKRNQAQEYDKAKKRQAIFEAELLNTGSVIVISKDCKRSPYISNLCFTKNDVEDIIFPTKNLISFSTGSACESELVQPSHVLNAMGLSDNMAEKCLRFSFGLQTTQNDIDSAIMLLKPLVNNV